MCTTLCSATACCAIALTMAVIVAGVFLSVSSTLLTVSKMQQQLMQGLEA